MKLPALLSFVCGFASLSLEILWVRLYGFAKTSTPAAFGFVLCLYLVGIALGASIGARACRNATGESTLWRASVTALLASAVLSPVLAALFAAVSQAGFRHPLFDLAMVGSTAAVLSFVFPIAHHLGTREGGARQGRHFARVYTANVAGAALGPLVTGYLLLETLSLQSSFIFIAVVQAGAAIFLAYALHMEGIGRVTAAAVAWTASLAVAAVTVDPHAMVRHFTHGGEPAHTVVENRHGIITIFRGPDGDNSVYGGNVYDGRTNVDPERNTNGLHRPLLMGALHPAPKRVLVVGLSIGSWLAVVREFPGVESVDVIEINPGYLSAAEAYHPQAAALRDPRVTVVIDDARRWLRQRPERRYDLVIMNTTMHWRSNASLLLSEQWLRQVKSHMAPGAVLGFNATESPDAFLTAARVFPHAYRYANFVYAADFDFRARKNSPQALATYEQMRMLGRPLFAPGSAAPRSFLGLPFVRVAAEQASFPRPLEVITDENMITEFRYGRALYGWIDLFYFSATP